MATAEYSATAGTVKATAQPSNLIGATSAALTKAASNSTDGAAFTTALATLVADGVSPTQAHVTAANNAWTTYKADIDAATAAGAAITADAVLYIGNVANVGDLNVLRQMLNKLWSAVAGSNLLLVGSGTPRNAF